MQLSRWRNLFTLNCGEIPIACPTTKIHFASIHATIPCMEKWKNKWNNFSATKRSQQQPKNYIRYSVRQKRVGAKIALNDLLYNSRFNKTSFQDIEQIWMCDTNKKRKSESFPRCKNFNQKKTKSRKEQCSSEFDDPETIFRTTFRNRRCTWTPKEPFFNGSTSAFEWREHSKTRTQKPRDWDPSSGAESDDQPFTASLSSDRRILGLTSTGPLKLEDVKNAFRLSALKWHPDKHHQSPTEVLAEEKFKRCVSAYKSLCSALSCSSRYQ